MHGSTQADVALVPVSISTEFGETLLSFVRPDNGRMCSAASSVVMFAKCGFDLLF